MDLRKIITAIVNKSKMMANQEHLKLFMSVEDISYLEDFFLLKNKLFEEDEDIKKVYVDVFVKLIGDMDGHIYNTFFLNADIHQLFPNANSINETLEEKNQKAKFTDAVAELLNNKSLFVYLKNKGVLEKILELYKIEKKLFSEENLYSDSNWSNNIFQIIKILFKIDLSSSSKQFVNDIDKACTFFKKKTNDLINCNIHTLKNDLKIERENAYKKLRLFLIMEILGK